MPGPKRQVAIVVQTDPPEQIGSDERRMSAHRTLASRALWALLIQSLPDAHSSLPSLKKQAGHSSVGSPTNTRPQFMQRTSTACAGCARSIDERGGRESLDSIQTV